MIFRVIVEVLLFGAVFVWGAWLQRFHSMRTQNLVLQIPKEMMPAPGQPIQIQFVSGPPPVTP